MSILWKYLRPQKWLILVSLLLAGISQLLNLVDPLIFGKIIDEYAISPGNKTENELVRGVLGWLGLASSISGLVLVHVDDVMVDEPLPIVAPEFGVLIPIPESEAERERAAHRSRSHTHARVQEPPGPRALTRAKRPT